MMKPGDIAPVFQNTAVKMSASAKSFADLSAAERPSLRRAHSPLFCPPWIYIWLLEYLHSLTRQGGRKTDWSVCRFHLMSFIGSKL